MRLLQWKLLRPKEVPGSLVETPELQSKLARWVPDVVVPETPELQLTLALVWPKEVPRPLREALELLLQLHWEALGRAHDASLLKLHWEVLGEAHEPSLLEHHWEALEEAQWQEPSPPELDFPQVVEPELKEVLPSQLSRGPWALVQGLLRVPELLALVHLRQLTKEAAVFLEVALGVWQLVAEAHQVEQAVVASSVVAQGPKTLPWQTELAHF